jgi:hypothetical protein
MKGRVRDGEKRRMGERIQSSKFKIDTLKLCNN